MNNPNCEKVIPENIQQMLNKLTSTNSEKQITHIKTNVVNKETNIINKETTENNLYKNIWCIFSLLVILTFLILVLLFVDIKNANKIFL